MQITINVRSGIVSGLIEGAFLLFFSPIISRATARVYNYLTTRILRSGKRVRIRDTSTSVEDLIPRIFQFLHAFFGRAKTSLQADRNGLWRQMVTLQISLILTTGIFLLGVFTDGRSAAAFEQRTVFLWNRGAVIDTTRETGFDGRASDIIGMSGVRSACVQRVNASDFNLHAVAFFEPQDFENGGSANESICVDGVQTKQRVGITLKTNRIFNPEADPVFKENMEGQPASFQFVQDLSRTGTPDFCRVNVSTGAVSEIWTFSNENFSRTRFAARATRTGLGSIVLNAGVAYHFLNSDEVQDIETDQDCTLLSMTMFANNRFIAEITEEGVELDLLHLELVVADMMDDLVISGYGRLESQDIMIRAYYAGLSDSDEDVGQVLGEFDERIVDVVAGETQITVISEAAVIGLIMTIAGRLVLVVVSAPMKPLVRMTSPAYVSAMYRAHRIKDGTNGRHTCSDLLAMTEMDGVLQVGPVVENEPEGGDTDGWG